MGHFPLATLALMNSFSSSNINHDTFKSVRSPVPRWRRKPQEDRTMKSIIRKDEAAVSPVIATILMVAITVDTARSEEHTSELQSLAYLVCRLLLEKKKKNRRITNVTHKM